MLQSLTTPPYLPFSVALGVMAGIALIEVVSALLGFALSHAFDSSIPHVDLDGDLDLNSDGHIGIGEQFAGWLHVGQVPVLILFILFLLSFGISGTVLQFAAESLMSKPLSLWLAAPLAFVVGLFGVRVTGGLAKKIVLKDETTAISADALLGKSATITLGATTRGNPTQAKLRDQHGQTHYVLVEPLHDDQQFASGESVMLIERHGHLYRVIEDSVDALLMLGSKGPQADNRS